MCGWRRSGGGRCVGRGGVGCGAIGSRWQGVHVLVSQRDQQKRGRTGQMGFTRGHGPKGCTRRTAPPPVAPGPRAARPAATTPTRAAKGPAAWAVQLARDGQRTPPVRQLPGICGQRTLPHGARQTAEDLRRGHRRVAVREASVEVGEEVPAGEAVADVVEQPRRKGCLARPSRPVEGRQLQRVFRLVGKPSAGIGQFGLAVDERRRDGRQLPRHGKRRKWRGVHVHTAVDTACLHAGSDPASAQVVGDRISVHGGSGCSPHFFLVRGESGAYLIGGSST